MDQAPTISPLHVRAAIHRVRQILTGAGPTQLEIIRDVMWAAASGDSWFTLGELATITHYGEASISAQLRHLRKPAHGSYVIEKRRREWAVDGTRQLVWEYQLRR